MELTGLCDKMFDVGLPKIDAGKPMKLKYYFVRPNIIIF